MLMVLLTLRFCSDPGVIYSASQSKNELVYSLRGDTFLMILILRTHTASFVILYFKGFIFSACEHSQPQTDTHTCSSSAATCEGSVLVKARSPAFSTEKSGFQVSVQMCSPPLLLVLATSSWQGQRAPIGSRVGPQS